MRSLNYETTEDFTSLHDPADPDYNCRYKVFYGGRGGRKSWEFARALISEAIQKKVLVLCTREIQNSIGDSVLRLLANQIELMGVSHLFEVQKTTIIGKNGSEFVFKGLNGMTIDSIKSFEGVDFCWVEEAHSVSERSWSILIPTIRKPGSKIYISFNPDLKTDPVYVRFVDNTPPNTCLKFVTYLDNPDRTQELIEEAEYLKKVDYDAYSHIWLGNVRAHSEAQIFAGKYSVESFDIDSTFGAPMFGADWGFSVDPTTLIKIYIKDKTIYIRSEAYKVGCEVDDTPGLFSNIPESKNYVIRADNARPEMISFVKNKGFRIEAAEKWPGCVEDRISFLRSFERIIIHPDCKHTAEEMRLYSYKVDKRTQDVLPDIVDKHNHCIDAIGYAITPIIRKKATNWTL
ncbi:MAG: PBSX family phage terminase large subunit [Cryomorphaceae bacterium]|nr:MAG: PBSX family phage terminase large subunit [Cryomorphaceae bacterium]